MISAKGQLPKWGGQRTMMPCARMMDRDDRDSMTFQSYNEGAGLILLLHWSRKREGEEFEELDRNSMTASQITSPSPLTQNPCHVCPSRQKPCSILRQPKVLSSRITQVPFLLQNCPLTISSQPLMHARSVTSVMSDSLQPYGLKAARPLCPCDSPGKNPEVGCHSLLQGIFPTQGSNLHFLHCRQILQRRQWHPSPVLLPGESHGQRSLVGCSPWGR